MLRIVIGHNEFYTLVTKGEYTEGGVTLKFDELKSSGKLDRLTSGGEISGTGYKAILSDIGTHRVRAILSMRG